MAERQEGGVSAGHRAEKPPKRGGELADVIPIGRARRRRMGPDDVPVSLGVLIADVMAEIEAQMHVDDAEEE